MYLALKLIAELLVVTFYGKIWRENMKKGAVIHIFLVSHSVTNEPDVSWKILYSWQTLIPQDLLHVSLECKKITLILFLSGPSWTSFGTGFFRCTLVTAAGSSISSTSTGWFVSDSVAGCELGADKLFSTS